MSTSSFEEVNVTEVIRPNAFWVTPIRRNPPNDEISRILNIEKRLPNLASDPDLEITRHNITKLEEHAIIAVKVIIVSMQNINLASCFGIRLKQAFINAKKMLLASKVVKSDLIVFIIIFQYSLI